MSTIDLAVLSKETFTISEQRDSHVININQININISDFKTNFFNSCGSFYFNPTMPPILFDEQYIDDNQLNLYVSILTFAVDDLKTSLSAITPISKIQLRNELYRLSLQSLSINSSVTYDSVKDDNIVVGNIFVISAIFINKNCCIKPVIIKFFYLLI
jgi:hypothetical protein